MAELMFDRSYHTEVDGEIVGNFTDNGKVIAGERTTLPVSGRISLSEVRDYTGLTNPVSMNNIRLRDLVQKPNSISMSQFRGAGWGMPHGEADMGVGMSVNHMDLRYEGPFSVTVENGRVVGPAGAPEIFTRVTNSAAVTRPAAYCTNGYAVLQPGTYTISFDFFNRNFIGVPACSGGACTDSMFQVLAYTTGYLNGSQIELVAYQSIAVNAADKSGSRSFQFQTFSSRMHIVPIWYWWIGPYNGSRTGIEYGIRNAKIVANSLG